MNDQIHPLVAALLRFAQQQQPHWPPWVHGPLDTGAALAGNRARHQAGFALRAGGLAAAQGAEYGGSRDPFRHRDDPQYAAGGLAAAQGPWYGGNGLVAQPRRK